MSIHYTTASNDCMTQRTHAASLCVRWPTSNNVRQIHTHTTLLFCGVTDATTF